MGKASRTIAAVAFTLVSCTTQALPAATPVTPVVPLRLYATTSAAPLVNNLAAAYARVNPSIRFDIATGNYITMEERLLEGETPYFISNHYPADSPLWAAPIGQDGIAIIVHPDNPLPGLTLAELRDIYRGWVENWSALGGADRDIVVITREQGSGTRAEFDRLVLGERPPTTGARIAPTSAAVVQMVAREPGAIGFVSMSYVDRRVRALALDAHPPTLAEVAANAYPLRTTLYVIGQREPETAYRAFIAWIQSPDGQAVVARGYAPLN